MKARSHDQPHRRVFLCNQGSARDWLIEHGLDPSDNKIGMVVLARQRQLQLPFVMEIAGVIIKANDSVRFLRLVIGRNHEHITKGVKVESRSKLTRVVRIQQG